jgi:hypothetical protein
MAALLAIAQQRLRVTRDSRLGDHSKSLEDGGELKSACPENTLNPVESSDGKELSMEQETDGLNFEVREILSGIAVAFC